MSLREDPPRPPRKPLLAMATERNVLRPNVPAWRATADDGDLKSGIERAGRLLAVRARSEHEIRTRLAEAGYGPAAVDGVIGRLVELSLIDDAAFARHWVADRSARKLTSPRVLLEELAAKGIDPETARAALAEAGPDEVAQAKELAARLFPRVARRPLAEQGPRLVDMVVRRGYSYEAAEQGAKSVLPPEGWD
jgi:regulatory protein